MSLVEEFLMEVANKEKRSSNKGHVFFDIFESKNFDMYSRRTKKEMLARLSKKGLIAQGPEGAILLRLGRQYVDKKNNALKKFNKPNTTGEHALLVMFDIPEEKKIARNWFRVHLKKFGYEMIQKSVWIGPDPLPVEFKNYSYDIGLGDCVKTFKLAKSFTPKKYS